MDETGKALREAREREAATREILRIVARTSSDTGPVFEAILERAARLCETPLGLLFLLQDDGFHLVAERGAHPELVAYCRANPISLDPSRSVTARSAAERRPVQVFDTVDDDFIRVGQPHRMVGVQHEGNRTLLSVPLLGGEKVVGSIMLYRPGDRPFDDEHVELVSTFADQAVIAIDNARRFQALGEALERQTATSEILRAISRSPGDDQPVFEVILERATRLCEAPLGLLFVREDDGLHLVSERGAHPELVAFARSNPLPLDPSQSVTAQSMAERRPIQIPDLQSHPLTRSGQAHRQLGTQLEGIRTQLVVPLLRGEESIGAVLVYRREVRPFDEQHVSLLSTFADQAVIAIDNVRGYRALGKALERQTATAAVLQVINRSPDDYQPVFDAILEHAIRLCEAPLALLFTRDTDGFHLVAERGAHPDVAEFYRANPIPLDPAQSAVARCAHERRPVHITDLLREVEATRRGSLPHVAPAVETEGVRTLLAVPLIGGDQGIGVIMAYRREVRPFQEAHVELLSTFADQAVIAIDNVRGYRALGRALERQTAIADILQVINRSPADDAPVFDAILEHATRLCDASLGRLWLVDGDALRAAAHRGARREYIELVEREGFPLDPALSTAGRALASRRPQQTADIAAGDTYRDGLSHAVAAVDIEGVRTVLAVPLVSGGESIGVITIYRREVRPFEDAHAELLATFADQAVIAIDNVRQFRAVETRTRELTESLERQTATSEILRAISRSPTDYQPVFETVLENASRLCEAPLGVLFLCHGDRLEIVASRGARAEYVRFFRENPLRLEASQGILARAAVERKVVQLEDLAAGRLYRERQPHRVAGVEGEGIRTMLAVPMVKSDQAVGVIGVYRREVRAFDDRHVELLRTFADQAVIAIENVRLFRALEARTHELTESLERQTATSEILRAISRSPTDYQPVFEAVLENASRLCEAPLGVLFLCRDDNLELVASRGGRPEFIQFFTETPIPLDPDCGVAPRAAVEARPVQVEDVTADGVYRDRQPHRVASVELEGIRTLLSVPMLKGDRAIGVIALYRREVRNFDERHVELLSTFADQAVIAIENVRLFQSLEARTRELTEALERQTATSEILRAISHSPTDYQPVFDAILENASRLCDTPLGSLYLRRGEQLELVAARGSRPESVEYRREHPIPLDASYGVAAQVAVEGKPVQVPDMRDTELYAQRQSQRVAMVEVEGVRTLLTVPLLKSGEVVGVLSQYRREVRPFEDSHIELLSTFADQAVIAIENVRLFQALEARTRELGETLERQTATSEILRAISRSPTDYQPVFEAILDNATRLCDAPLALLYMPDGDHLRLVAHQGAREAFVSYMTDNPLPLDDDSTHTVATALSRTPQLVTDIREHESYRDGQPHRVASADLEGIRSALFVPMLKNDECGGVICVYRREVRPFEEKHVELVSTFADQAVIAIDNVRLFQALEDRSRALARSVGELRALGEVGQAVSSTLDLETVLTTIINQAVALTGADAGAISEHDEATGTLPTRAAPGLTGLLSGSEPVRLGEGAMGGAAERREPVQIPDVAAPGAYTGRMRPQLERAGLRALLAVPLLREERVLGALLVARKTPGEFPQETVELLRTFAAQSALAIHNARLFRELEEQGRALEAANRHKSEFLANMSHELRTPLNAVIGFSEVLAEEMFGDLNEKQAEYVDDIHTSGRHLLSLINDILDLSKIEAGRMELDRSCFAVGPALDNALTLVSERASRRSLSLGSEIAGDLGEMIGDERKLKQIVLNLLSNAIKFTPEGGSVTLSARREDGAVSIAVRDTGVGIAPEDQGVIFEEFRQVGSDVARKVEGTGLGLALTRRFVEMHGGTIAVESAPGEGSEFRITLPLEPPEPAAVSAE